VNVYTPFILPESQWLFYAFSKLRTLLYSIACKLGLTDRDVTVHMPGGNLQIQILPDESVFMTGRVGSIGTMVLSDRFAQGLRLL